jgi:hypothetical protein
MKVWVLGSHNDEGDYNVELFDTKEKATTRLEEVYHNTIKWAKKERTIESSELNTEEGWAFIVFTDGSFNLDVFEEEVK